MRGFNWRAFLDRAENGEIESEEQWDACTLAGKWVTCACGNQCADIPRSEDGTPKDYLLSHLGLEFNDYIQGHEYGEARLILFQIEERAAEILKGLPK